MPERVVISEYDEYGNPSPAIVTKSNVGTVLTRLSTAITATTVGSDLAVGTYKELTLDINISAVSGTSPTYDLDVQRRGSDGVYYSIYKTTSQTAVGVVSVTIGVGAEINKGFGDTIRIVETVGGTTPSFTRSISIKGK